MYRHVVHKITVRLDGCPQRSRITIRRHRQMWIRYSSRLATEEEQSTMENAVLDAFNDVSARCGDVYERWMYGTKMVSQTIQDTGDGGSVMVAEIEMTISCFGCPDEEVFASEYPASALSQL